MPKKTKCTFCIKKGIIGPHNHTLHTLINNQYQISCPELLETTCNYCNIKGHTPQYCPCRREKRERREKIDNYKISDSINPNKRSLMIIDNNGFVHISKKSNSDSPTLSKDAKIRKLNNFTSLFGSLQIENDK